MTIKNQRPLGKFRNPATNRAVMVYQGTNSKTGAFVQFFMKTGGREVIRDFHKWGAKVPPPTVKRKGVSFFASKAGRPAGKQFKRIYGATEFGQYRNPATNRPMMIFRGSAQKCGGLFIYAARVKGNLKILRAWNPAEWEKIIP